MKFILSVRNHGFHRMVSGEKYFISIDREVQENER